MMERSEILATMGELKLFGMEAAFDGIIAAAVKRQHEPQRVIGDFVAAEVSEKQARSTKCQMTDPPPAKWSALKHGFETEVDRDGEQEAPA